MQLLRMMNRLLDKNPESRRRQLAWHTPTVVPVWPQVCRLHACAVDGVESKYLCEDS